MKQRTMALVALMVVAIAGSQPASAALITEVQSSFDEGDPFDIKLSLSYQFNSWNSLITRERIASGKQLDNDTTQPGEVVAANKLEYKRKFHEMHFTAAIGLYHELELVLDLPWSFGDQSSLDFHPSLKSDPACSGDLHSCVADIDPSGNRWNAGSSATSDMPLIDLPWEGTKRGGIGNFGVGVRWAPWHNDRDPAYPSWLIGMMVRFPAYGKKWVMTADNDYVADGLYHIELNTAISRRVAKWFEPYFDLHGHLRFASDKSLFDEENSATQTLVSPGHSMGMILGAEFIAWEVKEKEQFFSIDIGAGMDYVFEGREYGPLFEALGTSPCRTSDGCFNTTYTAEHKGMAAQATAYTKEGQSLEKAGDQAGADAKYAEAAKIEEDIKNKTLAANADDQFKRSDGITDVEGHGIFSGWLGLYVQPVKYLQLGFRFNLAYMPSYFITFADAGKDQNGDADLWVSGYNSKEVNEYNPKYIEGIDEVGTRFKASRTINWSLLFNLSGKF